MHIVVTARCLHSLDASQSEPVTIHQSDDTTAFNLTTPCNVNNSNSVLRSTKVSPVVPSANDLTLHMAPMNNVTTHDTTSFHSLDGYEGHSTMPGAGDSTLCHTKMSPPSALLNSIAEERVLIDVAKTLLVPTIYCTCTNNSIDIPVKNLTAR